jgi:hypothetical protein
MYIINCSNGKAQNNVSTQSLVMALALAAQYKMKGLKVTMLHITKGSIKEVF